MFDIGEKGLLAENVCIIRDNIKSMEEFIHGEVVNKISVLCVLYEGMIFC